MASRLFPCSSCTRHVKVGASTCPFCGGTLPTDVPQRAKLTSRPLTRVAIVLAGAAAATGCSSSSGQPVAPYGVAIIPDGSLNEPDGGTADAGVKDAAEDQGEFVTHYGVFVDSGEPEPMYGVAIIPDAGSDSH